MKRAATLVIGSALLVAGIGCKSVSYVQPFPPPPPPPPPVLVAYPPPPPPHGHWETRRVVVGHDACGNPVIGLRRVWIPG